MPTANNEFRIDPIKREVDNRRLAWDLFQYVAYNKPPEISLDDYRPREGSVPYLVIKHLKTLRKGATLSKKDIAKLLDVNVNGIDSSLWRAEKAGLLVRGWREELHHTVLAWRLPEPKKLKLSTPHSPYDASMQVLEEVAA